jgi:cytosolic phospholipase A2
LTFFTSNNRDQYAYKHFSFILYFKDFTLARCSLPQLLAHLKSRLSVHPLHIPSFADLIFNKYAREAILTGPVVKYLDGAPVNLVDVFGTFLSSRLLIPEDVERINDRWYKLSEQEKMVDNGNAPLPIYTVVRHVIKDAEQKEEEDVNNDRPEAGESGRVKTNDEEETNNRIQDSDKRAETRKEDDEFQWFEFTPYEIGCEDIGGKLS